jgi:glycosyltransferase involved in cell wall biosynthesis
MSKRILALSSEFPPFRGGIGRYALEVVRAAQELGADVTMVAPNYGNDHSADDRLLPFRVTRYAGGPHTLRDFPAKFALLGKMLSDGRYDIVHAMDWPFFLPAALRARHIEKRLYTIHGSDVIDMSAPHKRLAIRLSNMFSGRCEVLANSSFTWKLFLDAFPHVDPIRVRYVLLGVGDYWTAPADVTPESRDEFGLPMDKFLLLTVARVTPRKGQLGVIRALARLPERLHQRVCYAIVGPTIDKSYLKELENEISEINFEVRLLGELQDSDLRRIYALSDLFCLVGQPIPNGPVEGFGLVFLEAGAQGLPSIAGDFGGVKDAVTNNESGVLVPTGDPDALSAAISELLESPERLRRLADGARRRASDLSWRRCAAATYGL